MGYFERTRRLGAQRPQRNTEGIASYFDHCLVMFCGLLTVAGERVRSRRRKNQEIGEVKNGSGGSDITNATVTMNGVPFVYNPAIGHTAYEGNVNVASQGTVTVSVTIGNATYTASGTQYTSYPSITEPQSGATWSSIVPNTIQWSGGAPSTNSAYAFAILNAADPNGQLVWPADNNIYVVPLSTTSYSIPPLGSLNTGNCIVLVGIVKIVPIPNTTSDSGLVIGGYNSVPITVN